MHLPVHRLALLAFLLYAVPAFGQAGPQGLFFPGSQQATASSTFTNIHVGHGSIGIIGGSGNGSDQITNVNVNGVMNIMSFGAVADGSTDNSNAIIRAVATLSPNGGKVFIPSGNYNFGSTIMVPRNVTIECANTDSGVIKYTGSAAAFVFADAGNPSSYPHGGMNNCHLIAGTAGTGIGVFTGGDPGNHCGSGPCAPSNYAGDNLQFYGDKIEGFANGWEEGNNAWLIFWYGPIFAGNTTGVQILPGSTNNGETDSIIGGQIINGTSGIKCLSPNTDLWLYSISLDNNTHDTILNGDGTNQGCGIQAYGLHVEIFDAGLHPYPTPIIQVWGSSSFTNFVWEGGVLQLDDNTAATLPSVMKVTGGYNYPWGKIDNLRVSSNHPITFTGACLQTLTDMCIEGDGTTVLGSYDWWNTTNAGYVPGNPYSKPVPITLTACGSGPSLAAGSNTSSGEIVPGPGATSCTLNFPQGIGQHNIHCSLTDDGHPHVWWQGTKSIFAVTISCIDPTASNANCTAGSFVSYSCAGF